MDHKIDHFNYFMENDFKESVAILFAVLFYKNYGKRVNLGATKRELKPCCQIQNNNNNKNLKKEREREIGKSNLFYYYFLLRLIRHTKWGFAALVLKYLYNEGTIICIIYLILFVFLFVILPIHWIYLLFFSKNLIYFKKYFEVLFLLTF